MIKSLFVFSGDNSYNQNGGIKSGSIWKFEQDFSKYSDIDGISKKIYYLTLFVDGTYRQHIQIIPSNSKNYTGVSYYELYGKWKYKDNKLLLEELDKTYSIDYEYFNSNFENIDNIITKSK